MKSRETYRVALGGIVCAAAVTIMFLGSIIPFATFVSPALACVCVFYFCVEFGNSTALCVYIAIAALSLIMTPDKEQALLFVCVFGYYPIVKQLSERLRSRFASYAVKFAVFNISAVSLYYVITRIFVIEAVRSEFAEYTPLLFAAFLAAGNVTFYLFDILLTRAAVYYTVKLKPRISK